MNTYSTKNVSVTHQCDFCKTPGTLNLSIFNHSGWYYCQSCLVQVERLTNSLRDKTQQTSLFIKG
jgi:hypothetical protein